MIYLVFDNLCIPARNLVVRVWAGGCSGGAATISPVGLPAMVLMSSAASSRLVVRGNFSRSLHQLYKGSTGHTTTLILRFKIPGGNLAIANLDMEAKMD